MSLVRPVKLTVVKANDCEKLLFSITNYHSQLPNIVLRELLMVLDEIVQEYGSDAYIPIGGVVAGMKNRTEIRLRLPYRNVGFGERLDGVFWGFYDGLVHRLSEGWGVDVYRKGEK